MGEIAAGKVHFSAYRYEAKTKTFIFTPLHFPLPAKSFYSLLRSGEAAGGGKVFFCFRDTTFTSRALALPCLYAAEEDANKLSNPPSSFLSLLFSDNTHRKEEEEAKGGMHYKRGRTQGERRSRESLRVPSWRGHKRFIRMLSASVCLNNPWMLHFLSLLWQLFVRVSEVFA